VLRIRGLSDPWSWDPGWIKTQDLDPRSRFGMNIPNHISKNLEQFFWVKILKLFDANPDPRSGISLTLDQGSRWKEFESDIRDKHPGSATLYDKFRYVYHVFTIFLSYNVKQYAKDCEHLRATAYRAAVCKKAVKSPSIGSKHKESLKLTVKM
jgi:hypothetical protein